MLSFYNVSTIAAHLLVQMHFFARHNTYRTFAAGTVVCFFSCDPLSCVPALLTIRLSSVR